MSFATREELVRLDALTAGLRGPIAVAFSGGGDSLFLLAVARDWAQARGRTLLALHVDHGLRATSAAEAANAAREAKRLGVDCRVIAWGGEKPSTGVQAAARAARHALLARACAEIGVGVLLLGHTRDDQLETVLMRSKRTLATPRSLAGLEPIAPSPAWPAGAGLALARPLLGLRRSAVRARLSAAGLAWIDDPSNADLAFERIRARAEIAGMDASAVARLIALADEAARAEGRRRALALAALAAVHPLPWGAFALDRERFVEHPREGQALALEAVVTAAAGSPGPLPREGLGRLLDRLAPGAAFAGAAFAGAAIARGEGGLLTIARDPGAVAGRRPTSSGRGAPAPHDGVWDGRFRLNAPLREAENIQAAQGLRARLPKADQARLKAAPPLARRSAPVVVAPDGPPRLADGVFMGSQAIARRVLPGQPLAWCDDAAARRALGFEALSHQMRSCRTASERREDLALTGIFPE